MHQDDGGAIARRRIPARHTSSVRAREGYFREAPDSRAFGVPRDRRGRRAHVVGALAPEALRGNTHAKDEAYAHACDDEIKRYLHDPRMVLDSPGEIQSSDIFRHRTIQVLRRVTTVYKGVCNEYSGDAE